MQHIIGDKTVLNFCYFRVFREILYIPLEFPLILTIDRTLYSCYNSLARGVYWHHAVCLFNLWRDTHGSAVGARNLKSLFNLHKVCGLSFEN